MWIHWPFFPKTWTKGHWPLDDLWPHVCWGHMCDSTQGSLCPSPMTIHQCMWIQWSILQNTTYIHILHTYYIHTHTTYRMSDHIVSYWTQFRRDNYWTQFRRDNYWTQFRRDKKALFTWKSTLVKTWIPERCIWNIKQCLETQQSLPLPQDKAWVKKLKMSETHKILSSFQKIQLTQTC